MKKNLSILNLALLGVLTTSVIANQVVLDQTKKIMGINDSLAFTSKLKKIISGGAKLTGNLAEDAVKLVFMQGVPEVYGAEMGVNFDQVQDAINVMKQYDPDYGRKNLNLNEEEMKRYIKINLQISCEYCCGVPSIIREDGSGACGCAHSQAMRGLTAYLVRNHTSMSDDQILSELAKWKSRYFPKQMVKKMSGQLQSGKYTPDIASLLIGVKLPKYEGTSSQSAPLPSEIENAPGMVGGC